MNTGVSQEPSKIRPKRSILRLGVAVAASALAVSVPMAPALAAPDATPQAERASYPLSMPPTPYIPPAPHAPAPPHRAIPGPGRPSFPNYDRHPNTPAPHRSLPPTGSAW